MTQFKVGLVGAAVAVMGLVFSGASQSEDCDIGRVGVAKLSPVESTRLGGLLMSGLRGKYEVSVAYFVGNRELRRGRPLECNPVKYRIDTYYDAGKGAIGMMPGTVQTLYPWSVGRTAVSNMPNDGHNTGDDLSGADIIGFSLNVGPTKPGCAVIGSGNYLPEPEGGDGSVTPMPFALMPNYSKSAGNLACSQR
jgi:hypothetical protein